MNKLEKDTKEKKLCSKCELNIRVKSSSWCRPCLSKQQKNWKEKTNYNSKEYQEKYYQENKERLIENALKWGQENKEKRSSSQKKYLKNNINAKLAQQLRCRMYSALKENNKSSHTFELLGCTLQEFKNHLESQFTADMNWGNYGEYWEMDHIVPCSSFNLKNLEEQKKCFTFTNIQPLEKIKNRQKSNKLNYE